MLRTKIPYVYYIIAYTSNYQRNEESPGRYIAIIQAIDPGRGSLNQ